MKRFVICLGILTLIIAAAVGEKLRLNRSVDALCAALQSLTEATPSCSVSELQAQAQEVSDLWQKEASFLHMAEIHRTLEQAEQTLESLPQLAKSVSREELILKCIEANQQLQNMARSEMILPENIF